MSNRIRQLLFSEYSRDYYGGALILLIGLASIEEGLKYQVGSLTQMGSGFFPVSLGVILCLLGVAIAGSAKRVRKDVRSAVQGTAQSDVGHEAVSDDKPGPEWRGWFCISASVVAFVVLGRYGGLLPATFGIVFIAALGDRDNSAITALVLALILCALCVAIFWWALQLQFPLFTWG